VLRSLRTAIAAAQQRRPTKFRFMGAMCENDVSEKSLPNPLLHPNGREVPSRIAVADALLLSIRGSWRGRGAVDQIRVAGSAVLVTLNYLA